MSLLVGLAESYRHIANISMLYLIVVMAVAVAFGRGPAILASVMAFLTFDWFFVKPLNSFTIAIPEEWVALLLFLLVAVSTGQLAAALRQRAEVARQREREASVLYDVVRLMSSPDLHEALHAVAERLRQALSLSAVAIELREDTGAFARAAEGDADAIALIRSSTKPGTQILADGPAPTAARPGKPGRWIRILPPHLPGVSQPAESEPLQVIPVKVGDRRVGRMLLVRQAGATQASLADDRLLSAAATQLAMAVERARLQREATQAEILRRTDELKSALLNAVSHDLRTPLASILASAGSLRQPDIKWSEEERKQFAEAIEEETIRLNQIVGNLLDLSRIEGGSLRPEKDWYDLGTLVEEVLGRLRPLTAQLCLIVSIPEDLPPILLDYVEIDQVLSNLIENAAKYTKRGTEVEISARRANGELEISVADRGPGIPSVALPHLFEPFFRVARKGPRPKGTGLGLAVAKGLVEAHGGRIWAENRPDGGARFVFTLPLAPPAESTAANGEVP
ncbi:MAG: DUF4118 domain-containing protein [Chloroflexi bacterium]|nr:DUF4118 domain-containing protein [Chloroflexota bacterium]